MKKQFFLLLMLATVNFFGQTVNHIQFDYDGAGNQVKRHLIYISSGKQSNPNPKDISSITEEDLVKADIYDDIKYYPNPVKEELYVKWSSLNSVTVKAIALYNLNGQLLKTVGDLEKENAYIFPFQEYPQAIYNLILMYNDGSLKSLKIIKQ